MKSRDKTHNCIWIEIENHQDAVLNEDAAKAVNKMLKKLDVTYGGFEWNQHAGMYHFVEYASGSFFELPEDGHTFNLDYLAK